ncbi:PREDICTED: bcl-2-like protein 10 isoform X1 [Rhinopithecus bieti]|uniref:bcl-2-like protein 10 isoform X1 n=1 Tax=Rhinopithecus bieti TaxID=61621 RepID=UPI00083C6BF9|nr:PREDICTED: bcl-2-like protein 10 isoform X1 [Rhinopithecus bieti]
MADPLRERTTVADPLRERTERLLADYLGCCAREPGTPEPRPSTPEAAVLRSAAARLRQLHRSFFSAYLGYPGNRVELVALMAEAVLSDSPGPTWGRVVSLVTFAGTLLEREPLVTAWWKKRSFQPRLKEQEGDVARDCQRLVALLSSRLTGQHRAWLQAQGGWVSTRRTPGRGAGRASGKRPRGRHGWLLSLLQDPLSAGFLEKTADPGFPGMLVNNSLRLPLDTIIMSFKIFNPLLPAQL